MFKSDKHIQVLDGYLSDDCVSYMLKQYAGDRNIVSKDPYSLDRTTIPFKKNPDFYMWFDSLLDPILDKYKERSYTDFKYDIEGEAVQILKYYKGDERFLHAGDPHKRERISISCLIFLTDGHEGGDVYFPDQGIKIKPKKGRIVLFPSCFLYPHEVTRLESIKPRYTLTRGYQFVNLRDNYRDPNYVYESNNGTYDKFDEKYAYTKRDKCIEEE